MNNVVDRFNTPICLGDIITYPGRRGSRMWMNVAVVTKIKGTKVHVRSFCNYHGWSFCGINTCITNLDNVTILSTIPPTILYSEDITEFSNKIKLENQSTS